MTLIIVWTAAIMSRVRSRRLISGTTDLTPRAVRRKHNGAGRPAKAKRSRADLAYHQRRREARDRDDQALLVAMRDSPEGSIGDWAAAIGKGRSSTVSALKRLRDAGLAESVQGKWRRRAGRARASRRRNGSRR